MKRLDLIFEKLLNLHLVKDVGQIPYILGKFFGFSVSIVCRDNDTYDYFRDDADAPKLIFVRWSSYFHLIRNAGKIDVLMLFHIRHKSICQGILYKLINPRGCLYLKSDLKEVLPPFIEKGKRNFISQAYNEAIYSVFCGMVDVVSFETQRVFNAIKSVPDHKKLYLPNGFDITLPEKMGIKPKSVPEKKEIILCVARHGSQQKNSELLLEALERIDDMGPWKIVFVGPATDEFKERCETFRHDHPNHADKILLAGEIRDRRQLFGYYNDAKIFCLPSRWESWGIVCTEALFFGCALIMTRELVSSPDLTDNGRVGLLAGNEDADEWANVLKGLMNDAERLGYLSVE
ncbi:MAG TPA: glycosyltransferase family 4 protein, partial [Dissulfurispiraceae bacterium]|nr:glycosyltransferase family 4 protein [Dissulfurispiraceae bacterium]